MPDLHMPVLASSSAPQADPRVWLECLQELHDRFKPAFWSRDGWSAAGGYLVGLLSGVDRKNTWQMAEEVGLETPYAFERLLGRGKWDAEAVRDTVRDYALEHLGHPDAVLVLDETGFLKKGTASVGVKRQYSGTAGRIENSQIGVFLAYASPRGVALIDRALLRQEEWADDPERRRKAGVPTEVEFETKSELGWRLLEHAFAAGVPKGWVTADEAYGKNGSLRAWLESEGVPFVMAVASNQYVTKGLYQLKVSETLTHVVKPEDWVRLSAGDGEKGPRWYDWARIEVNSMLPDGWKRWVLFRRRISDGEVAFYLASAPGDTTLETLVRVAGSRWNVEIAFEQAKSEVGLDQYEVRTWVGWHRHITLSMAALAFLAAMRAQWADQKGAPPIEGPKEKRMDAFKLNRAIREGRWPSNASASSP